MFEVTRREDLPSKGLFGKPYSVVILEARAAMSCQFLKRTFQGHGIYSTQTYQIDIAEGDRFILKMKQTGLKVGSRRMLETLVGEGWLHEYARLIATT